MTVTFTMVKRKAESHDYEEHKESMIHGKQNDFADFGCCPISTIPSYLSINKARPKMLEINGEMLRNQTKPRPFGAALVRSDSI